MRIKILLFAGRRDKSGVKSDCFRISKHKMSALYPAVSRHTVQYRDLFLTAPVAESLGAVEEQWLKACLVSKGPQRARNHGRMMNISPCVWRAGLWILEGPCHIPASPQTRGDGRHPTSIMCVCPHTCAQKHLATKIFILHAYAGIWIGKGVDSGLRPGVLRPWFRRNVRDLLHPATQMGEKQTV